MKRLQLSALALIAGLGFAAAAAQAQAPSMPPPPPGAMGDMHDGSDAGGWSAGGMRERGEMRRQERLRALHNALNIRPEQEAAFANFTESMKPMEPPMGEGPGAIHGDEAMGAMTTPARVDAMLRHMDEHMARMRERMQRHAEAVKGLYAVLGPDQRHTLDALPELMDPPHGAMGMEHHGPMDGDHEHEGE